MGSKRTKKRREQEKRQRSRLYVEQGGRCYYCGCQMFFYELKSGESMPSDGATIEHLDSRLNPERGKHSGDFRKVMCCNRCNQDKNREEEKALGIEELRRRSGR